MANPEARDGANALALSSEIHGGLDASTNVPYICAALIEFTGMTTARDPLPTRDALVEAAGELFAARGFAAVTARQVAEHARVALSAIPYHFGSMNDLYRAVLLRACEAFAAREDRRQPALEAASAAAGLRMAVTLILEDYASQATAWPSRILTREELDPSDTFREVVRLRYRPQWEWTCRILARATRRSMEDPGVHLGAVVLYAQVDALFTRRWLIQEFAPELQAGLEDRKVLADMLIAMALQTVKRFPASLLPRAKRARAARKP